MPTELLIQRAKRGDKRALRELLQEQRGLVEAVVGRFLWDRAMREDIVQNIMLRAVTSIGEFKGTCRFSTWLYRIAVNECIEGNRRGARWTARIDRTGNAPEIFADPNAPDGLAETIREEQRSAVSESVAELPDGMRRAIELYYRKGCSGAEAARELGITAQALFVRLSDARSKLKGKLIGRGVVPC